MRRKGGDPSEANHGVEGRRGGVICPGDDEGHQQCLELGGSALGAKMVKNWVPNGIGGERHCS
jgi:hypothetical protein